MGSLPVLDIGEGRGDGMTKDQFHVFLWFVAAALALVRLFMAAYQP